MAKIRVEINRDALRELMKDESLVAGRAEAVAAACNGQSSWGGYASESDVNNVRAVARVWSYASQDGQGQTERAQRLIKNLDAGR